ncbi:hypothetical protein FGRMN_7258 [Fusarium graminum]|nr:hypothetical protein FGRMN_7258 [Fusarium graminum]
MFLAASRKTFIAIMAKPEVFAGRDLLLDSDARMQPTIQVPDHYSRRTLSRPLSDTPANRSGDVHPDPVEDAVEAIVTRDLLQDSLHAQGPYGPFLYTVYLSPPSTVVQLATVVSRIDFSSVFGTIEQLKNKSIDEETVTFIKAARSLCNDSSTENSQLNIRLILSQGNLQFCAALAQIIRNRQEEKETPPLDKYLGLSPTAKVLTKVHLTLTEHYPANIDELCLSKPYSSEQWLLHNVMGCFHENYSHPDFWLSSTPQGIDNSFPSYAGSSKVHFPRVVFQAIDADIPVKVYSMLTHISTPAFSQMDPRHHTNNKFGSRLARGISVSEVESVAPTEDEKISGGNDR